VSNPPSQAAEPVVKCGYGSSDERSPGKTIGDANAARQRAASEQRAATQRVAGQTSQQSIGAVLPTDRTSAPLTVRFGNVSGYQGNAHVISMPPGIDCPSTCSFQFGQNAAVMLFATADQNSAVKRLSCQMSSGTGMLQAGNSMSCSIALPKGGQAARR
jgi:hypothetical protein